jgi:hypothetical protein
MMHKTILIIFLIIGLIGNFQIALAQNDDLDLLEKIEQETKPSDGSELDLLDELAADTGATPSKNPWLEISRKLVDNVAGSLRFRSMFYTREAEERPGADLSDTHFNCLLRFNTWTGGDAWRFDVAGWVEGGNEQGVYSGVTRWFRDDAGRTERRHLEINELSGMISKSDYDLVFGKKIFKNGLSTLFSPANRLPVLDLIDPLDPKEFGLWQVKLEYYWDQYTLTGAVLPVFDGGKIPPPSSRWTGRTIDSVPRVPRDFDFRDIKAAAEDYPEIEPSNFGYFGRVKTTYHGWDMFFSVYDGLNPYPVLKVEQRNGESTAVKQNVRVGNYATGFSTTWKKWEFHGEGLYNHSYNGKDDNYANFVGGITYIIDDLAKKVFLERIDITIEYAFEWVIREQYATDYMVSSRNVRLGKNDIFTRIQFKYNKDLNFVYVSDFELEDNGRYNHFEANYAFGKGFSTKVAIETFNGNDESYYGRWNHNDRIIAEIKYAF